jgi:WD40 repeat protein
MLGAYTGEGLVFRRGDGDAIELVNVVGLHDNAVKGIATNDTHLFSVCATGAAAFHSIDGLEPTLRVARAHEQISNGATRLSDGRFASVSRDRCLRLWSPSGVERTVATPHRHSIKCVTALPQEALIATGAYDGSIAIYDVGKDRFVAHERPTAAGISCLTVNASLDGFLASSYDGNVYEIATPRR